MSSFRAPSDRPDDWTRGPPKHAAMVCLVLLCGLSTFHTWNSVRPGSASPITSSMTLDINRATAAELELLPRIGPKLAQRILEDRRARGPFRSVDELDRVPGIGPRTIESLRAHLMVAGLEAGPE